MKIAFEAPAVWRTFGCNSMALVVPEGKQVLFSGQVAWDEQRRIVGIGDMRAQADQVFLNIKNLLEAVGGEIDDVVSIVTYVTTPAGLREIHEVRAKYFSEPYPVSTLIEVAALVHPDLLIEITATAVVPEDRYHPPQDINPNSFNISEGGFNI